MAYIDALFFAAGTATQSGLNTIDVNTIFLYQQIIFMLGACLCTPIFINTVVVFVRLYWFERRFEHIVKEVRANRKKGGLSFSKSRSKSKAPDESNQKANLLELGGIGVRGKAIEVLKDTGKKMVRSGNDEEKAEVDTRSASVDATPSGSHSGSSRETSDGATETSSEQTVTAPAEQKPEVPSVSSPAEESQPNYMGLNPRLQNRGITFADEVETEGNETPELARIPEHRDSSKHIQFLERQTNDKNDPGTIYIPGPRDFDRGEVPTRLSTNDALRRLHSRDTIASRDDTERRRSISGGNDHSPDQPRTAITITEPDHPGHRTQTVDDRPGTSDQPRVGLAQSRSKSRRFSFSEGGRQFSRTLTNLTRARSSDRAEDPMPYLSWTATTGRNSAFLGLSAEQREELGGIEYRALKTLAGILIFYYAGFHIMGLVVFLPWIVSSPYYANLLRTEDGQNPRWWGVFTPASMFNDLGLTITPDSMISFQKAGLPLLFGAFLIVIGNTGFPVMLRFIIWVCCKFERLRVRDPPDGSRLYQELRFLLDHPRRCFTLLFPSKATWWLFWILVLLNGIDLIFFVILDLDQTVVESLTGPQKVLNGFFQAVSTRTAGFSSVNLAELHAAIQVSYLVMMYISVFPIAISVRRTNVYEEKSLGIFGGEEDGDGDQSYVSQHLRRQLSFDLWFIFLGLFIISIVEGDRVANTNEPAFTTFSILFEIVSAYGTVGLSLGYTGINASFSAEFRTLSKLIIIAMMIRGRHRGLPYALDRAILLPSEKLQQKEAEDADRRMARRASTFAEGQNDFTRSRTWEQGDLDDHGLPIQHTGRSIDPMTEGAGGDGTVDGLKKLNTRRSNAGVSVRSNSNNENNNNNTSGRGRAHTRNRSLSRVVFGGLSAGPTLPKQE